MYMTMPQPPLCCILLLVTASKLGTAVPVGLPSMALPHFLRMLYMTFSFPHHHFPGHTQLCVGVLLYLFLTASARSSQQS